MNDLLVDLFCKRNGVIVARFPGNEGSPSKAQPYGCALPMSRGRSQAIAVKLLAACAASGLAVSLIAPDVANAALARQTQARAEINLLHAARTLGRLEPRLVDPRSLLFRTNTKAHCKGLRGRLGTRWFYFVCTVTHDKVQLRLLYIAQTRHGFEIRRLKT